MVTKISVVVHDLLKRADAKVSHLEELEKTQAKNFIGMKFNMVDCKRILVEVEVAMGALELGFQSNKRRFKLSKITRGFPFLF